MRTWRLHSPFTRPILSVGGGQRGNRHFSPGPERELQPSSQPPSPLTEAPSHLVAPKQHQGQPQTEESRPPRSHHRLLLSWLVLRREAGGAGGRPSHFRSRPEVKAAVTRQPRPGKPLSLSLALYLPARRMGSSAAGKTGSGICARAGGCAFRGRGGAGGPSSRWRLEETKRRERKGLAGRGVGGRDACGKQDGGEWPGNWKNERVVVYSYLK